MSSNKHLFRAAGLILLAIATCGSCEKGEVLAPAESTIVLTAVPNPATFPPGVKTKEVTIEARLRTKEGFPQQGVNVTFTTTSLGTLTPTSAVTNSDSIATAKLTLLDSDPDSVDVAATSGGITQTVKITKRLAGGAPSDGTLTVSGPATVTIDPASTGQSQKTVSVAAVVKDKPGQPLANVSVRFTTDGCTVADPAANPPSTEPTTGVDILTDSTGTATANVTIQITDPVQCSIFVQAGALNATTSIAKTVSSAPSNGTIRIDPNPSMVEIPTANSSGQSTIQASVLTADGQPIRGIAVRFSATGGQLSSGSVITDSTGLATVTLTLTTSSPASVTVKAISYAAPDNTCNVSWMRVP
jgi:adhesin/invasin